MMEKRKEYPRDAGRCINILTRRDLFVGVYVYISSELDAKLEELELVTGIPKEEHIRRALTGFVDRYESRRHFYTKEDQRSIQ